VNKLSAWLPKPRHENRSYFALACKAWRVATKVLVNEDGVHRGLLWSHESLQSLCSQSGWGFR